MGIFTAQILVGGSSRNYGGINPSHYMFLWENSTPTWNLVDENIFRKPGDGNNRIFWVPSGVEHMLEDALLMIAYHIVKDPEVIQIAREAIKDLESPGVQLHLSLDKNMRDVLIARCRAIENWPKLVITVTSGSSVSNQVDVINNYNMDVEICMSSRKWGDSPQAKK